MPLIRKSCMVFLLITGYAYASESPNILTKEELLKAGMRPGYFESGRLMTEQEAEAWFDKPTTSWGPSAIMKSFRTWYAGKNRTGMNKQLFDELKHPSEEPLDCIEKVRKNKLGMSKRFFAELKDPSEESLDFIKHAIFEDQEMRYAIDPATGLSPIATLIIAYPKGTEDEKEQHRNILAYLLDVGTGSTYGLEHPAPLSFADCDIEDLQDVYMAHNRNIGQTWEDLCSRLRGESNMSIRLHNVSDRLQQISDQLKKEEEQHANKQKRWSRLLLGLGALVGYTIYWYLSTSNDNVSQTKGSEQAQRYA